MNGSEIKDALKFQSLTQVWLIGKLDERGITVDKSELSSVLSGVRRGPKAERIKAAAIEIIEGYKRERRSA